MQNTQEHTSEPLLLTIEQVMATMQLGRNKVYDLINREGLPVQRFGRRVLVRREALQEWLRKRDDQQGM